MEDKDIMIIKGGEGCGMSKKCGDD